MNQIFCFSVFSILGVVSYFTAVLGFPDGAPVETCIYKNYPNHPGTKPITSGHFPYAFYASSDKYFPGEKIKVVISGPPFKGFFVQARDGGPDGKWIGKFVEGPETKNHPECSAITHKDPQFKKEVVLIWQAPSHHLTGLSGKVVFLGTILAKYDAYWVNMIAETKFSHGHSHSPYRGHPQNPLLI